MLGRPRNQPSLELAEQLKEAERKNPRWRDEAHCRALDYSTSDSIFFDVDTNDPLKSVRRAFCNACPVQKICRLYGDVNQPDYGAYGGYTAKERRLALRYPNGSAPIEALNAE